MTAVARREPRHRLRTGGEPRHPRTTRNETRNAFGKTCGSCISCLDQKRRDAPLPAAVQDRFRPANLLGYFPAAVEFLKTLWFFVIWLIAKFPGIFLT